MAKILVQAFSEVARAALARVGEQKTGLDAVQTFLTRFGYLQAGAFKSGELDTFTCDALRKYQECNGLQTTGEFDSPTRDQIATHRCALPDAANGVAFVTRCAWERRWLTYAFNNGTNDVTGQEEFQAVRDAFRTWAAIVPITFTEVAVNANPDILIDWRNANDPDLSMVGGTLAHADFPQGCGVVTNSFPKPIHFDDSEHAWSIGAISGAFDVQTVALHEIGHILGLQHSTVTGAVMFASVSSNSTLRVLQPDDIAGIRGLYPYPPAVVAWSTNRLDVFGLGTDWAIYHKAWDGSGWYPSPTDWEPLGGVFHSPPSVTAWGPNRLDIFGLGMDRGMYHKAWDGSAWYPSLTDWESLGGVFTSPPAVVAWGPNRLDIFGLGTDAGMYHKAWDGSAWQTDWEPLGGLFTSPPAVVAWGPNRLDIFGLGTDRGMYHKAWDGSAWYPSPTDWESLGGVFS